MIILSRRCGQSVTIGDGIEVLIVSLGDGKVRLGITAPEHLPIHKRERYQPNLFQDSRESPAGHNPERVFPGVSVQ